ncbi:LPXTG cell wall anchor domain-containing protein [Archaeoglobus sp.]
MGRTPLIFLTLLILSVSVAYAVSVNVSCPATKDYYTEGEYILFVVNITPKTSDDAKNLCKLDYEMYTSLDSAGIIVEIELTDGKLILHPTPEDIYATNNGTTLKFFLPETEKSVDKITIKVFGHVPGISARIQNITLLSVHADTTKLLEENITVVNAQKFYKDIKNLEDEACSKQDREKLDEALLYYNDREYWKAERKIAEVEKSIAECRFQERTKALENRHDSLKDELSDIRKDLTLIEVKLELKKDVLENYDKIKSQYVNLTAEYDALDKTLDDVAELIDKGRLDDAEEKLDWIENAMTSLKTNVTSLLIQIGMKEEGTGEDIWLWLILAGCIIVLSGVGIYLLRIRKRDMW